LPLPATPGSAAVPPHLGGGNAIQYFFAIFPPQGGEGQLKHVIDMFEQGEATHVVFFLQNFSNPKTLYIPCPSRVSENHHALRPV